MWVTYQKLWDLFDPKGRFSVFALFLLMLAAALIEAFAVASVFPLVTSMAHPNGAVSPLRPLGFFGAGLNLQVFIFCGAVVFSILLRVLAEQMAMSFSLTQNVQWSRRLLRCHLNRDYDWFLRQHGAEIGYGLLSRVQDVVTGSLLPALRMIVNVLLAALIFIVLLRSLPAIVLLGVSATILLYCGIFFLLRKKFSEIGVERESVAAVRFRLIGEIFGGIKEVKLHGLESAYDERIRGPFQRYAVLQSQRNLLSILPRYAFEAIGFIAICLVVPVLGAPSNGANTMLPMLGMIGFAAYRLLPAIQQIYQNAVSLPIGLPALNNLYNDLVGGNDSLLSDPVPYPLRSSIALNDVKYAYPGAASPSITGANLSIAACTTVALVGRSGAGKSTLADISIGLLTPTEGEIQIDGVALDAVGRRAWRASCAYVPQHVFLLDDSIAANIAFGESESQWVLARIEAAARAAALHSFVSNLTEGYSTRVGERGVRLSGGQRQRIGIARALYRDASYLVLDEATNALDPGTEAEVMMALEQLRGTHTLLIIAHRLSTVERCDRVLLVDNGRIVADGRYHDLLRESPEFRRFANTRELSDVALEAQV